MIFHITYLSDGLRVKGYLCLPYNCDLTAQQLQEWLEQYYGCLDLPVELIACRWQSEPYSMKLDEQQWPVFIYCRGGIGKVGSVKLHWLEQFMRYNHIVFAPSYRGNEGGEGRDEFGGADQEDVHAACRMLQQLPYTDEEQFTIMGFSRGAINAVRAAIEFPRIHRLIVWGGVSDLACTYEERVDLRRMLKRVIGGNPTKLPESYEARSSLLLANQITCPVLIMHGTDDQQVDHHHGLDLYHKLTKLHHDVTMHAYEGYGHHLPQLIHQEAIAEMFAWIHDQTPRTMEK